MNIDDSLVDVIANCITDWMDTGTVNHTKYNNKYNTAITAQQQIGWRQLFMGKISKEWLTLQQSYKDSQGNTRDATMWSATLIEICLRQYIELWEQRNRDVHGHNEREQAKHARTRYKEDIRTLYTLRHHVRSNDDHLFPANIDTYLEKSSTNTLAQYISTNREAILHSVKQAQKKATENTKPLEHWFKPTQRAKHTQQDSWQQDNLIYDAYSKKRRSKDTRNINSRTRQTAITQTYRPQ